MASVWALLEQTPCVDCGEADPLVLEFDHVRGAKIADISRLVSRGASWAEIVVEMEKCDVVCRNCHARRTAKQFGWHKLSFVKS